MIKNKIVDIKKYFKNIFKTIKNILCFQQIFIL